MAHYAYMDSSGVVVSVLTGVDEWVTQTDTDGSQVGGTTEAWEAFYAAQPWHAGLTCKRTSYHGNIRSNYAGIGYTYDAQRDAFIAPQPYASWTLDESTCRWVAPVPMPTEDGPWVWDEATQDWSAPHV